MKEWEEKSALVSDKKKGEREGLRLGRGGREWVGEEEGWDKEFPL